jgi:predicted nucleic acid-binding protein
MRALLDVNVLIALHDANHAHHAVATQWLIANIEQGWASCALTQNGCLRIMAQSGYSNPQPLPILVRMLQKSTQSGAHEFWGIAPACWMSRVFNMPTFTALANSRICTCWPWQ